MGMDPQCIREPMHKGWSDTIYRSTPSGQNQIAENSPAIAGAIAAMIDRAVIAVIGRAEFDGRAADVTVVAVIAARVAHAGTADAL